LCVPSTVRASMVSDGVTTSPYPEASVSNALNLSLDLAEPFTLEASWQYLETDTGKLNTISIGGDIKFGGKFDLDALADFAPRTAGVRTIGVSLIPTYELDEGDDFYTSFSLPLLLENYDILQQERIRLCMLRKKPPPGCALMRPVGATEDDKVNQLGLGLVVEQGIFDLTVLAEFTTNFYDDKAAIGALGREIARGVGVIKFNQIGGLLPTFPVKHEGKLQLAYKFRFGEESWFTLKPVVSGQHLIYEADHGHGEVIVAKIVATFAKTIELTAGYQVLLDNEVDTTMPGANSSNPPLQSTTIHYAIVGLGWIFRT
jgi:hypothetical protein